MRRRLTGRRNDHRPALPEGDEAARRKQVALIVLRGQPLLPPIRPPSADRRERLVTANLLGKN